MDIAALYNAPTASSIYPSPCPQTNDVRRSDTDSATPTPSSQIPRTYSVPRFEDYSYSPRGPFKSTTPIHRQLSPDYLTPDQDHIIQTHKKRLSRTLSSQHVLAEALIPSPLFSRGLSSKKESQSHSLTQSLPVIPVPLPQVALSRPLPPTPTSRPLPNLPFNHNPRFIRKGKRFVVVPRRKTALSTLISRWEGRVPFSEYGSPSSGIIDHEAVRADRESTQRTPVTERFRKISAIFVEKEERPNSFKETIQQELKDCVRINAEHSDAGINDSDGDTSVTNSDTDSDKENTDPISIHNYGPKPSAPPSPTRSLIPRPSKPTSYPCTPKTPCPTQHRLFSPSKNDHDLMSDPTSDLYTPTPTFLPVQPPPPVPQTNHRADPLPTKTYTSLLLSLQKSLTLHTTTITSTIQKTLSVQELHDQEKRSRFFNTYHNRRAPSPSVSPPDSSTKMRNTNRETGVRNSRITPSKDVRLRSFWSLQDADAAYLGTRTSETRRGRNSSVGVKDRLDDEVTRKKKDRIAKLKEEGWNVRKERVGFKGVEFYEALVGAVEGELQLEGR